MAFWISLSLATGIPMLAIVLFGDLPDPNQLSEERYRSAELLMNYVGPSAVAAATAEWPEEARAALRRHLAAERQLPTTIERPPMQIGARYWGYAIRIVIGVAGSLLLALYLARPLRWLRNGFRRITRRTRYRLLPMWKAA